MPQSPLAAHEVSRDLRKWRRPLCRVKFHHLSRSVDPCRGRTPPPAVGPDLAVAGQAGAVGHLGMLAVHTMRRQLAAACGALQPRARARRPTGNRSKGSLAFRVSRAEYDATFAAATHLPGRDEFWLDVARREIDWFVEPTKALRPRIPGEHPTNDWFPDGQSNLSFNALDRHVAAGNGDRTAIAYHSTVGGNSREISYQQMLDDVASFAGALRDLGVEAGDRVLLYMPMIPESAVAMLACTRIGAVHSVVFGGFAAAELAVRIDDAAPKVIIAATCGLEGGKGALPYMPAVNESIDLAKHHVPSVVVVRRKEEAAKSVKYDLKPGRDHDFETMVASPSRADPVPLSANAPLYTIYTSGTTGDPKGILRDNSHAITLKWSMAAYYGTERGETFFAASDIGWVVGHSYIVYAPLLHGCTSVMFEGKPVGTPDAGTCSTIVCVIDCH